MSAALEALRKPFPTDKVYQREGPGGKKLDYVAGETVIERLLEFAENYSWVGRVVSVEDGRAIVEGTLTVPALPSEGRHADKHGYGVGSAKMGSDVDSSLKAANTEALKNAAKNGFGIALELWSEEHRANLATARRAAGGSEKDLKKAVFDVAKKRLNKTKPTVAEVAETFGYAPADLSDTATLRAILEKEGVL